MDSKNQIIDPVSEAKNSSEANKPSHQQIRDEPTMKQMNRNKWAKKPTTMKKAHYYENSLMKLQ